MDYLVFRLYGPMASWGQAAVGGDRPSGMAPGRGALLGLLCAALGIRRGQADKLAWVSQNVVFSVKQQTEGGLMRDYHTVQTPAQDKKYRHRTRKSELSGPKNKLNTVLSSRDYRTDGVWVVAVESMGVADHDGNVLSLRALQQALRQPAFPLYLGRKSCPLAVPLSPEIVSAEHPRQALDTEQKPIVASERHWLRFSQHVTYYWQGEQDRLDGVTHKGVLSYHPWDDPVSRDRWQFGQRQQHQLTVREA